MGSETRGLHRDYSSRHARARCLSQPLDPWWVRIPPPAERGGNEIRRKHRKHDLRVSGGCGAAQAQRWECGLSDRQRAGPEKEGEA
jgi:hypothetical protein